MYLLVFIELELNTFSSSNRGIIAGFKRTDRNKLKRKKTKLRKIVNKTIKVSNKEFDILKDKNFNN